VATTGIRALILAQLAWAAGCNSPSDSGPGAPLPIKVAILDSAGVPVIGAHLQWQVWPAVTQDTINYLDPDPLTRTDSLGNLIIENGSRTEIPDSIRLFAYPPGCKFQVIDTTIRQIPQTDPDLDTLALSLTTPWRLVPATLALTELCAYSIDSGWGVYSQHLGLKVDSIRSPLVYGRWDLNYRYTRGDDVGTFSGYDYGDFIVLDLVNPTPWAGCDGARLYVPVKPDHSWGTVLAIGSQGCLGEPVILDFVVDGSLYFP
jgi:hypothetical protein